MKLVVLNSGCVVYSNSLTPGHETTETTSFLDFHLNAYIPEMTEMTSFLDFHLNA